jgi:1-aminocyclopropane-1-carboxylate deaminase/D-cysteine desulfhydrase-like pyridoxal-dependent ACC family enzyme
MAAIDLDTLREMLRFTESLAKSYGAVEAKLAQNAALTAAGLDPLYSESSMKWDRDNLARCRREAECLRQVITYHEGGIFAPKTEAA